MCGEGHGEGGHDGARRRCVWDEGGEGHVAAGQTGSCGSHTPVVAAVGGLIAGWRCPSTHFSWPAHPAPRPTALPTYPDPPPSPHPQGESQDDLVVHVRHVARPDRAERASCPRCAGAYVVGPHEYRVRGWKGAMGGLGVDIRARRACPSLSIHAPEGAVVLE